ncbi:MAG: MBL fold metallo-hydrolase [Vicinamibacterales bacterium]
MTLRQFASRFLIVLGLCAFGQSSPPAFVRPATKLQAAVVVAPSRPQVSVWTLLSGAAQALGGEARLRSIAAVELNGVSVWYQREQSERPEGPWVATYTDFTDVRNFGADAVRRSSRARVYSTPDWVDNRDWTAESTTLVASGVGLRRTNGTLAPAGTPWDLGILPVGLGPERVVLAAIDAKDARMESDEPLDGYTHHVVSFTSADARVRLILNVPSLLPKAVEITRARPYEIFWAPWGDVSTRVTFGVWTLEPEGVRYPRLWEYSTGGQPDGRIDITRVRVNPAVAAADFEIPGDVREHAIAGRRRVADAPFGSPQRPAQEIAPGVVHVPGSWDIVEIKQDDGVVILDGPLSSDYSAKVIADASQRFGGAPVKAVVTTSDSWPHIGGMREYVARGIPVYALDLNVPILTRLFAAKYDTFPDALARSPKRPVLHVVAGKTTVGAGANRLEIYPLRTATGERQMMVYLPQHQLLYTSDLFTINQGRVFLPQQVGEAVEAAAREHLTVTSAIGMHYDVLPWAAIVKSATPPLRAGAASGGGARRPR